MPTKKAQSHWSVPGLFRFLVGFPRVRPAVIRSSRPERLFQHVGQIGLMFLLVDENLANVFRQGVFASRTRIASPAGDSCEYRLILVVEIELEHFFCLLRNLHRVGLMGGLAAKIVDLLGDRQRV